MWALRKDSKIVITGISGLVGQNLALRLSQQGFTNIHGIDKNAVNTEVLKTLQPDLNLTLADLATPGEWAEICKNAEIIVINQAQIGGLDYEDFDRNNVIATQNILNVLDGKRQPFIIQISSSVVNSTADDFYTRSKTEQEEIILDSRTKYCVLRPTLMFGWFDRKHLGWLRLFMQKTPVFPIPGHGRYRRQPLYVGDFCNVIIACMKQQPLGKVFDISGQETIDYIDLIRTIKKTTKSKTLILKIPYSLFFALLWIVSKFSKNPPFTIHQLRALVIPEVFPVIDWPGIFGIQATRFEDAVDETFNHTQYSSITLQF